MERSQRADGELGRVLGFDHVQIAAPREGEARAKAFYGDMLGLREIPKPEVLRARGGAWYRCGDSQLHLGLDDDFKPQHKSHPAFLVGDLDEMRRRLEEAGLLVLAGPQIPGYRRFESRDPFGNRLEFMQRMRDEAVPATDAEITKALVREVFGRGAEAYVASPGHAAGDDLDRLVVLAEPRATDVALDIATGGGHTALALAPHVAHMTASDITPRMLGAARAHASRRGIANVAFVLADAERLPFLDEAFDLVTVRIAPHHFADIATAVGEMQRVLRTGGRLVVIDNIAPEDAELDRYLNTWERMRDPSHVRAYTIQQWRAFLTDTGLRITTLEVGRKTHDFPAWVARTHTPEATRVALEREMAGAPGSVRGYFEIRQRDGRIDTWSSEHVILQAER